MASSGYANRALLLPPISRYVRRSVPALVTFLPFFFCLYILVYDSDVSFLFNADGERTDDDNEAITISWRRLAYIFAWITTLVVEVWMHRGQRPSLLVPVVPSHVTPITTSSHHHIPGLGGSDFRSE